MHRASYLPVVILAASFQSACHKAPPSEVVAASSASAVAAPAVTQFDLDLDGDARPDTIILQHAPEQDGPGKYVRLAVKFATGKTAEMSGLWDDAREADFPWTGNLLPTRSIYAGRFTEAGTLLFLFGEDVGCCLQSMQILQVSGDSLIPYYSQKEFALSEELRSQPGGITMITGFVSRSETTGSSAPDAAKSDSYLPTVVVRLGQRAEVDIEASAKATRLRLGGFAGTDYREDILAITATTGEKYLWDEKAKRRVP